MFRACISGKVLTAGFKEWLSLSNISVFHMKVKETLEFGQIMTKKACAWQCLGCLVNLKSEIKAGKWYMYF